MLGAARHSSGNVQKAWKFLVFLHGRPLRTAHGFPNPHIVSRNPSKTVGKQANPAFLGTQMVTVPWPCIGDASGKCWIPNAESSKTVENEGFLPLRWNNLQWSLTTANCFSKSANGFPKTFENSGKTSKSSISGNTNSYGSLAMQWGRLREMLDSLCGIIQNSCKMKVS